MPQNNNQSTETLTGHPINGYGLPYTPLPSPYELRSDEVQDIMSKMPHWMIRKGITLLLAVMALLFVGAYSIHYPDVILTTVSIISSNPPVKIVAQSSGKLQQIFTGNNEAVRKDESICLLENGAVYNDIIFLKNTLFRLDTNFNLAATLKMVSINRHVQLGELQSGYADLYQSIQQYRFFTQDNFVTQKVDQLKVQVEYQSELNKELQNKDVLLKQQLELEKKRFGADSSLAVDKVIAPLELEERKRALINQQMNADETRSGILHNKLQQTEYIKTITDLHQQKLQQENDLQQKIRENVKRLQGQLDLWEQKYLIKSPVDGKAVFFKFWKENQYVSTGEVVLMIVPPVHTQIARASLPVNGAGKVKVGQKVLIKLSSYPFEEFGMIRGKVKSISAVALDTAYSMEILLTAGLTTTTHKQISPHPYLSGWAEVLTDDKNILERLFEKICINRKEH